MTEFNIRSDNVDVEQIMRQIRARIREKRGVDYTEEEVRELANAKLEKFLDPRGIRSDLLKEFQRARAGALAPPNFSFEEDTLFTSSRGIVRFVRKLLKPILKLFFSPNPLVYALHVQAELNTRNAQRDELQYELVHNLVVEITRLGIEVKNLKMRLESMSSRLDFDERRARALEGVVQYRPGTAAPLQPPAGGAAAAAGGNTNAGGPDASDRRTRRRRRRGRKRSGAGAGQAEPVEERPGQSGMAAGPDKPSVGEGTDAAGPRATGGGAAESSRREADARQQPSSEPDVARDAHDAAGTSANGVPGLPPSDR